MTFYTAIDLWIGGVLVFAVVAALSAIPKILVADSRLVRVGTISILLATVLLVVSSVFTRYEIGQEVLLVKAWPFVDRSIVIEDIYAIEQTRDPASAPALSLDRIRLFYKNGHVTISPRNREEFCALLHDRNRNITCS